MAKSTMKIQVMSVETTNSWTSIEDILAYYNEDEVVEIVGRYMDAQRHAINYRQSEGGKATAKKAYENQKIKTQLMKSRLAELEAMVKVNGQ